VATAPASSHSSGAGARLEAKGDLASLEVYPPTPARPDCWAVATAPASRGANRRPPGPLPRDQASSRFSQARAKRRSRSTVGTDTSSTVAISSWDMPPK